MIEFCIQPIELQYLYNEATNEFHIDRELSETQWIALKRNFYITRISVSLSILIRRIMTSPRPSNSSSDMRGSLSDSESRSNQSNRSYEQGNQSQQRLLGTPRLSPNPSSRPSSPTPLNTVQTPIYHTIGDEDPYTTDLKKDLADKDFDTTFRQHITLSLGGLLNTGAILLILLAIIGVFAGLPIGLEVTKSKQEQQAAEEKNNNWNSSVPPTTTVPLTPGGQPVIDPDTPLNARTKTSMNGETWKLVFSDEFNKPGRTFYPGDDPFWQVLKIHSVFACHFTSWGSCHFKFLGKRLISIIG
jgi:hypothetical protein